MKYYVTIYIDKLLEIEIINSLLQRKGLDFTHTFLGLTRKHPDELDKLKFERNIEYWDYNEGKMKICRKEEIKWYEKFENVEFNDGFYGFGTGTDSFINTAGKVFENNHLRR